MLIKILTAIKRAQKAGLKNVSYIVGNYLYLDFPDNHFDGIFGIETFCHIEDKDKPQLFHELLRVLKPGGRIAVFDAFMSNKPKDQMYMPEKHTRVFRGWTLPDRISTVDSFLTKAKKTGLRVVKSRNMVERILEWSKEVKNRLFFTQPFVPLVPFFVKLREKGIELPLVTHLGFDDPKIRDFIYTTKYQYDMFRSVDVEYWEIVLQKPR